MIWVIGGTGMLGCEVCSQLKDRKFSFVSTGSEIDITNAGVVENFIQSTETINYLKAHNNPEKDPDNGKIKWIINCSGYTDVEKAEEEQDKADLLNNKGVLNIARAARNHGAKLIHISTDYVFDGDAKAPVNEKERKNPCNVYGKTKADGEDQIISSMTQYYILRTSWLYGFNGENFVYTMARLLNTREGVNVVKDQTSSPTCCADLAQVICLIIEKTYKASGLFGKNSIPTYGIYNFCNKGEASWLDFAAAIKTIGKKAGKITGSCKINPCTAEEYGGKAARPAYSVLDTAKIEKELKIKIPEWQNSLATFIKSKQFILK